MEAFADGLAVRVVVPYAVEIMRRVVGRMLLLFERDIARGIGAAASCGLRVEGAAGAGFASLLRLDADRGPLVLIVTGRNIGEETYRRALRDPDSFPD